MIWYCEDIDIIQWIVNFVNVFEATYSCCVYDKQQTKVNHPQPPFRSIILPVLTEHMYTQHYKMTIALTPRSTSRHVTKTWQKKIVWCHPSNWIQSLHKSETTSKQEKKTLFLFIPTYKNWMVRLYIPFFQLRALTHHICENREVRCLWRQQKKTF